MDIEELRAQHKRIDGIAAEFRAAIDSAGEMRPVAALRWQLARELMAHLAVEDRLFYPSLIRFGDDDTSRTAAAFQREVGRLSDDFTAYLARWTEDRIAADWDGFREESRTFLASLADRMRREEVAIYPLAARRRRAA